MSSKVLDSILFASLFLTWLSFKAELRANFIHIWTWIRIKFFCRIRIQIIVRFQSWNLVKIFQYDNNVLNSYLLGFSWGCGWDEEERTEQEAEEEAYEETTEKKADEEAGEEAQEKTRDEDGEKSRYQEGEQEREETRQFK